MGLLSGLWNAATWVWNQLQNVAPGFTEAVSNAVTTVVDTVVNAVQNTGSQSNPPAQPRPPTTPTGPTPEEIRQQQINRRANQFDRDIGRLMRPELEEDARFYDEYPSDRILNSPASMADMILLAGQNPVVYGLMQMMRHERQTLAAFMQHPVRPTADTLCLLFADAVHYEHFTAEAAAWWDQLSDDFVASPIEEILENFNPDLPYTSEQKDALLQAAWEQLGDDPGDPAAQAVVLSLGYGVDLTSSRASDDFDDWRAWDAEGINNTYMAVTQMANALWNLEGNLPSYIDPTDPMQLFRAVMGPTEIQLSDKITYLDKNDEEQLITYSAQTFGRRIEVYTQVFGNQQNKEWFVYNLVHEFGHILNYRLRGQAHQLLHQSYWRSGDS